MHPPIIDPKQRDKEMTDYLYKALVDLPHTIGGIETEAAAMLNCKREAQVNLEDAELNATLNAAMPEKSNADSRKLIIEATLAKDELVKKFRKEVQRYEAELEMNEAEAKSKRREFQAAVALAELHAARINAMNRVAKTN